jgi:tripartite motif-containing protein 71
MRRFWIVLVTVLIVAAGVTAPRAISVSASGHIHSMADQKKCKKGQHRVHGTCKKKHAVAPTPVPTAVPGLLDHPDELAVDAQGNIFVTEGFEGASSRVLKLSPTGQLLATFGTDGSGPGQFYSPFGVALDPHGNLYVADFSNDRVQKLSPTGQVLLVWGTTGSGPGQFNGPVGIALDAQGNVYVTDVGTSDGSVADYRIQKFSPDGHELSSWGSLGSGPGQFKRLAGIAFDAQGNIYVTDQGNHRIQKLSPTGQPLASWGTDGTGPGQFGVPEGIALDSTGNIYVADRVLNRIQKLSPTGQVLAVWDAKGTYGFTGNTPFGIAVDGQGNVYVADHEHSRILKLSPSGEVLATFK